MAKERRFAWSKWLFAIALGFISSPSISQTACYSALPEIAPPLLGEFPTDSDRWGAAERIWSDAARDVWASAQRQAAAASPAADLIQGYTQDILREAIRHDRDSLAEELAGLWMMPFGALVSRDRVIANFVNRNDRVSEVVLGRPYEMWVDREGVETTLQSALLLAGAMDVVLATYRRPDNRRSEQLKGFAHTATRVALSHFQRWAFGPGVWQVRGWGCNGSGLTLVEFTNQRLNRLLGNRAAPFCDAPTDIDLLIAIGIIDLLAVTAEAPELVDLPENERQQLLAFVRLQTRFFGSRLVSGKIKDLSEQFVSTVDFDPGAWTNHPDFAYAGDEGQAFPTSKPLPKNGVGWDFSHGSRIGWAIETFASNPNMVSSETDWISARDGFARLIAYRVAEGEPDLPLFRNFLDGSNGWYRVNYADRMRTGTPPYGLSRSFLSTRWAALAKYDPLLSRISNGAWRLLTGATVAHCTHFKRYFVDGSYWSEARPASQSFSGAMQSLTLLPFLAVAPVQ